MTTPTIPTAGSREGLISWAEAGSPEPAVAGWRRGDAWMLLVLVLAGSLLRLAAALVSRGWESAPDQLAWGLLLEEWIALSPRFDQLLTYPHEGGTIVLSVLALVLRWLAGGDPLGVPVLSWVALLVDTVSRAIQCGVVHRVFGRVSALVFALWTMAAVPGLIPWATVNFGQHGLAAWAPFVVLVVAVSPCPPWPRPLALGVTTGLTVAWSLDAIALAPTAMTIAAACRRPRWWRGWLTWAAATTACLVPLALARTVLDDGFELESLSLLSVRGLEFSLPHLSQLTGRLGHVLVDALPAASLLPHVGPLPADVSRIAWSVVVVIGIGLALRGPRRRPVILGLGMAAVWAGLLALSPLAVPPRDATSVVAVRHLAFILPLVVALSLHGLSSRGRAGQAVAIVLCLASAAGTWAVSAASRPPPAPEWRGAGWVLGRKLGHDPERLTRLLDRCPEPARELLAEGVGWGLTATLLHEVTTADDPRVARTRELVRRFPARLRGHVEDGARLAFSPAVSPRLDSRRLQDLDLGDPDDAGGGLP